MCDPKTQAQMNMVSSGVGTLTETIGAFRSARAEKTAYEAEARINEVNARLAELTAQSVVRAGQLDEQDERLRTAQIKSAQTVGYAASGVALDSPTVARVAASTDIMGEIKASTVKANAAREAWGVRTRALQSSDTAEAARLKAKSISPSRRAARSLLTGAASVKSKYDAYVKDGVFK